jgi:hypothetical protein
MCQVTADIRPGMSFSVITYVRLWYTYFSSTKVTLHLSQSIGNTIWRVCVGSRSEAPTHTEDGLALFLFRIVYPNPHPPPWRAGNLEDQCRPLLVVIVFLTS